VVACADESVAARLQSASHTAYFRPYWSTDVVGTEIGGSVKNVIALANGMAVGMGFGENAQSSLITRGLAEMTRLGIALGASPLTFLGLAGIGDLVATCQSPLSRNRSFGEHLGRGLSIEEATADKAVAVAASLNKYRQANVDQKGGFTDRSMVFRVRGVATVGQVEKAVEAVVTFDPAQAREQATQLGRLLHWREE